MEKLSDWQDKSASDDDVGERCVSQCVKIKRKFGYQLGQQK